jgi:hypothetical protein
MAADPPVGLGDRGLRLWEESLAGRDLGPTHRVLLEEACRIADRLEALDGMIRALSQEFASAAPVLAESRQQSMALQRILTEVRQGAKELPAPQQGGSGVASLAAQAAKRRAKASG